MVSSMTVLPSLLKKICPICPIINLTFSLSLIEYLEYKNFVNSDRSLSDYIRSEIHPKVVFVVTLGSTFHNVGTFWVLTNWRHCQGTKAQIFPRYKRYTFTFDCWSWRTVRYQQGCASFTWWLHLWRIQFQNSYGDSTVKRLQSLKSWFSLFTSIWVLCL